RACPGVCSVEPRAPGPPSVRARGGPRNGDPQKTASSASLGGADGRARAWCEGGLRGPPVRVGLVREAVAVGEQRVVSFVELLQGDLLFGARPGVRELALEGIEAEEDLSDAVAFG